MFGIPAPAIVVREICRSYERIGSHPQVRSLLGAMGETSITKAGWLRFGLQALEPANSSICVGVPMLEPWACCASPWAWRRPLMYSWLPLSFECGSSNQLGSYCWWPPHKLKQLLELHEAQPERPITVATSLIASAYVLLPNLAVRRPNLQVIQTNHALPLDSRFSYNEIILDSTAWTRRLPQVVQAVFFLKASGRREDSTSSSRCVSARVQLSEGSATLEG